MKFTPIAALVMSSLAAFAQSASAQTGAEGRMNFLRDSRAATSGPQFEFSRLQYGPLPIAGSRVASTAGPLQAAERGDAKAQNQLGLSCCCPLAHLREAVFFAPVDVVGFLLETCRICIVFMPAVLVRVFEGDGVQVHLEVSRGALRKRLGLGAEVAVARHLGSADGGK